MGASDTNCIRCFSKMRKDAPLLGGQVPSDYPEFAEYLGEIGIGSISLNPGTLFKTARFALDAEKRLGHRPRS